MLKDVQVGDKTIDPALLGSSIIHTHLAIASSSATTRLPASMRTAFTQAFERVTGQRYHLPLESPLQCSTSSSYTHLQIAHFPAIQLVLEASDGTDLVLSLTPSQYLLAAPGDLFCGAIVFTDDSSGCTSLPHSLSL